MPKKTSAKQKVFQVLKRDTAFLSLSGLLLLTGFILSATWYYHLVNPDAASYFTIAQKYAHFDIKHALNGYWGPLLSWLLVPAVWLHIDLGAASKYIATLSGVGSMALTYYFLRSRGVARALSTFAATYVGIYLVFYAVKGPDSPDVLMAFLVGLFAVSFDKFLRGPSRWLGVATGATGALMYFAKGFGLYLFIAVVAITALWQWWHEKKTAMVISRCYAPMAITFVVLILPFIGAISLKYHHPTINTAGTFDHSIYGPISKGLDNPVANHGPLAPPNAAAISVWEDPTFITPLIDDVGWSPLGSWHNFHYFISSVLGHDLSEILSFLVNFGPAVLPGVLILALGCLRKKPFQSTYALFGLITLVMAVGYAMVYVEDRYLLAVVIFAAMGGALWLSSLQQKKILSTLQIIVGGLSICGYMLLTTGQTIVGQRSSDDGYYQLAKSLQSIIPRGSNIISNTFESYSTCYYLDVHCFDVLTPPAQGQQAYDATLKKFGIQYYVYYDSAYFTGLPDNQLTPVTMQFLQTYATKIAVRPTADGFAVVYRLR